MEVGRVLVLLTILLPVVAKYTTRSTPKTKDIDEISDISKKYKIKLGHKMEPVIFEPQKKIRLSRSTYKVNSYIDFKPYVISTVFESKDKPTQMTKQSFTIVDFITYRKSIHFELICKDVHN